MEEKEPFKSGTVVPEYAAVAASFPAGLEPWLRDWVREALAESRVLAANGAEGHARARCRVIVSLVEAARGWLDTEVDVTEAAETTGCCEETIRRAVRAGALPDRRPEGRGRHRVRRGDLAALGAGYDPASDAVDLAARRAAR